MSAVPAEPASDASPPAATAVGRRVSFAEYMDLCEADGLRYERHDGVIVLPPEGMSGGSPEHGFVKGDGYRAIANAVESAGRKCGVFDSDQAVHIEFVDRDVFPDASAFCGTPEFFEDAGRKALVNPCLVVEVLSPSTRGYDLGRKFTWYRSLESLQEYVVVEPEPYFVQRFRRQTTGWLMEAFASADDRVSLESVGVSVRVGDFYAQTIAFFGDTPTPDGPPTA